jgi:hypothetical protein
MRKSRFSEEQFIGVLLEQEAGARTEEVCCRTESARRPSNQFRNAGSDEGILDLVHMG